MLRPGIAFENTQDCGLELSRPCVQLTRESRFLALIHDHILPQSTARCRHRPAYYSPSVRSFRYALDPLCLSVCFLYAFNRWLIKPIYAGSLLQGYFNDLLLIPAALPLVLWLQRRIGLRNHDRAPTRTEIFGHLLVWSIVSELAAPGIFPWATSDAFDVLAYSVGALAATVWWNYPSFAE